MKNKPIIALLTILFIASTACAVFGFLEHKKKSNEPIKPVEPIETVKFEYYLENEAVDTMPTNTEENTYAFSKYQCENNIKLEFNSDEWKIKVIDGKEGLCKLYFVKSKYDVTITATNGLIDSEEASKTIPVNREDDTSILIVPNEGYEFSDVECANDKEAVYDLSSNTLTINSIMEDTACKVNFKIKTLKLDLTVKNGKGTTTETAKYGESVSAVVKANDGYENPKIECTNDQEFTFTDNKLTIEKLTNNTKCTVTFVKTPIVTYKLKINTLPEGVVITNGNQEQTIVSGKDGKFALKPTEGHQIKLDCNGVKPSSEETDPDGSIVYTFLQITKDITCNVTLEEITQEP